MNDVVKTERDGAVLRITINRPERRNALNEEVCAGIAAAIDVAEASPGVRVVVLTGSGDKVFCAGGDLKPGADGTPFVIDPANPRHYVIQLFRRLERCGLPVIARVNGHAMAGGLGLVCACDMAVSTDTAQFGVPESKLGLFPMMILSYMMRIIPRRKLYEIATTGEPFSAAEALAMDIVNYVFHQWGEHKWGYDFDTLQHRLRQAGFAHVERMSFGHSLDPRLACDRDTHAPYSLYVDAVAPVAGG